MMIFLLYILIKQYRSQSLSFTDNKNANTYRVRANEYTIEQSVYNVYFVQDISEPDINLFISIGLKFSNPKDEYVDANFSCSYNDSTLLKVVTERNGMNLRKQNQMIIFQPQTFKLGTRLVCQISKLNDEVYKYQIQFNKNNNTKCYNDCQDQGICVESIGLCRCGTNQLDLDCSKRAFPLQISNLINQITFINYQYFYIDTDRAIEILKFRIVSKNQTNYIKGYVMKENFIDGVPSQENSEFSFMVSPERSELEFNFDLRSLKFNNYLQRYDRFLITLETQFTSVITLQITPINTNDQQMEIFIYFGVGIGFIICFTLMVLRLYQHHKNVRIARVSDVSRFHPEQNRSQYFSSIRTSETIQTEPNVFASFIDQYMTVVLYKNIRNTTKIKHHKIYNLMRNAQRDQCSICLAEYEQNSKCRFTPCYHLFHSECLLQWINSHLTCPICRKNLGRAELQRMDTEEFRSSIRI